MHTITREPELVAAEAALTRQATPIAVTADELEVVKRTIANGATEAELQLFLYDCRRRGVHPMDGLIHFTKRGGKYTPVTSIDYFRSQAAMTGEMAGSDDAAFVPSPSPSHPDSATVTVYRITQGQRFPYSATARWSEYKPETNDFMWLKMPHTMLGKCAEALALRKAFPKQLAGLYVKEEMDQAERTPAGEERDMRTKPELAVGSHVELPEDGRDSPNQTVSIRPDRAARLPTGIVFVTNFVPLTTRNKNVTKYTLTLVGGPDWPANQTTVSTINPQLADKAETAYRTETPVRLTTKHTKFGYDVESIEPATFVEPPYVARGPEVTAADIPFR